MAQGLVKACHGAGGEDEVLPTKHHEDPSSDPSTHVKANGGGCAYNFRKWEADTIGSLQLGSTLVL